MTLTTEQIKQMAILRIAVGFLGEQATPRWWTSSFCGNNGKAFLAPVFPRTYIHAQYQGVVSAAALVHDDRIGVGNVFHLFRLPEDIEQALQRMVKEENNVTLTEVMRDVDSARHFLCGYAGPAQITSEGPVKVGHLSALRNTSVWKEIAAFYLKGFEHQRETFPFFSDRT
jgi:hypothetical protein